MLRNKLFLIIFSIIAVVLSITGYINYKNINEIFNIQIEQDIKNDEKILKNHISNIKKELTSLVNEIVKNDDLKSSLNLISLYENPNDYVKEIFDFEKNNLIELSNKWIKDDAHYSMAIFDKDLNLIMINRRLDNDISLGYVTYDEKGVKRFLDFNTKKNIKTPFIDEVKKQNIDKFRLNFYIERFLISYLKPIKLDGELIGYVKLTSCIDSEVLKTLNDSLNQTTILLDSNENYIFPSKKLKEKLEYFKSSDSIELVKLELLKLENTLYSLSLIDKSLVTEKTKNTIISILEILLILLVVIVFVSKYFIEKFILDPINNLKDVIDSIKKGKALASCESKANDEISVIVDEFNKLSVDLSKNLAFLESYELAMDESSIVTKADLKGNITYVNENFCRVTGYTKEEALGKPHSIVRHKDNSKETFKELWETIKNKKVWKGVLKNKGKLGDYWVDISILPILDENKNIVEYIAIRHDITKMMDQKEELENLSNTDTLTGLGNRYKLSRDIKEAENPALAIINIDNFSQVNDFYGHDIGDDIIKKIGLEISKLIKDFDTYCLYHLQGDEYVIFTPNTNTDRFIENIMYILDSLKIVNIEIDEEKLSFNFSIAVSFENSESILTTADMALKIAKREDKSIVIYSEELSLNKEYENNIKWTKKIKEAIENDSFIPVFQPIVNNSKNTWEKYECLVRLEDGDKLISPYFFLDISKKTKHYTEITKVMIEKSFEAFKDRNIEFSLNLTIEDILNSEIKTFIFDMLQKHQIGKRVVFEIVESESIENFEEVLEFITEVKSFGCKIAIDDFGTGYSNFEYLVKLNADYLKIDGSLIKDIDTNKTSQVVVKNLVNFAKDLDMKTIAEFVENDQILTKVKELKIDYSQGYYFSSPKKELK